MYGHLWNSKWGTAPEFDIFALTIKFMNQHVTAG